MMEMPEVWSLPAACLPILNILSWNNLILLSVIKEIMPFP
jgi:hypothetical protein